MDDFIKVLEGMDFKNFTIIQNANWTSIIPGITSLEEVWSIRYGRAVPNMQKSECPIFSVLIGIE